MGQVVSEGRRSVASMSAKGLLKGLAAMLVAACTLAAVDASAQLKIAVLNVQRALGESEEAKGLAEGIQQDLQEQQDELQALQEEIQALQEQLEKDAEILGDDEKRRIGKDIEDKRLDLEFGANKLQKEVQDRQEEILRQMAPKLDAVLKDLIEIEGYDVVLQRSGLLYVNTKHDITRKVTEKLNEKQ
ncbi:MAG: OmpH family outer membrane protein [Gammaproteobacteria bacterium]|nr:OmpH family outer membrane protein [Gammaproteobacteria bacterium]MYE82672.1 OmpH family outer membrane protein [Gammaproteobacteria bacterium]